MRLRRVIESSGGVSKRAGLTIALTVAGLAILPAFASGATVSKAGGVITYTAAAGETNNVVVDDPAGAYTFAETPITAGAGCTQTNANLVTCPNPDAISTSAVTMSMGDMADTANATATEEDEFTINGEAGDDILALSDNSGNAIVVAEIANGGGGNDWLYGGPGGPDDLNGDAGNDRMDGGAGTGNDDFDGGVDLDRVQYGSLDPPGATNFSYTCTAQAVNIDLDNAGDDDSCANTARDNDNVQSTVESVTGSTTADTITGSCGANTFAGSAGTASGHTDGNDTLNGDPGACAPNGGDFLGGGEGNDVFNCDGTGATPGVDTVTYGNPYTGGAAISVDLDDAADDNDGMGNTTENVQGDCERIIGTANGDTIDATNADQGVQLFGRLGGDTLTGSGFDDLLNGEDGTDVGNCGGGTDTAISIETPTACEL